MDIKVTKKGSSISLAEATALAISRRPGYLVREFDISLIVYGLYNDKSFGSKRINVRKHSPETSDINRVISELLAREVIEKSSKIPFKSLYLKPNQGEISAQEVACFVDPLGYLSYLSAMEWHGLTDRRAKVIQLTSARGTTWTNNINDLSLKILSESPIGISGYQDEFGSVYMPGQIGWRKFEKNIAGQQVVRHESADWNTDFFTEYDNGIRVSDVGYTFLDMIKKPDRCGGIYHVLEVFEEHGKRHRNSILKVVNAIGNKIDKARIGYIMEEVVGIDGSPTLEKWVKTAVQRGGSRKLDADNEYKNVYSERWCISINI